MQKILMHIGDSQEVRHMIREAASVEDLLVARSDASSAFQWFRLGKLPDVIVCEMNLPDLSGHQVLQGLRNNPATREIPIVLFASYLSPMDERLMCKDGAAACFRYSVPPGECIAKIRQLCSPPEGLSGAIRNLAGTRGGGSKPAFSMRVRRLATLLLVTPFSLAAAVLHALSSLFKPRSASQAAKKSGKGAAGRVRQLSDAA
jgi:CheY-like chemotaxis protein